LTSQSRTHPESSELYGPQADTTNNEMELEPMLKALDYIRQGMHAVSETDSQLCIDSLSKYRKRWENNGGKGWRDSSREWTFARTILLKNGPALDLLQERERAQ
jgi:ribonuclease HI